MRKLIFILLAFLAVFTYIRAFERAEAGETQETAIKRADTTQISDIAAPPIPLRKLSIDE